MRDNVSDIAAMYNQNVAYEHERLERHQLEFELTWRYLTHYLPPACSVLEIGAATGRYTLPLCQAGYTVTAVDLSSALLDECQRRLTAAGLDQRARCLVADARDLQAVTETEFDAVLLMGPLYHLVEEEDRILALQQAVAKLKDGGLLFTAFISRMALVADLLSRSPEWIEQRAEVEGILKLGYNPDNPRAGGFRGYFATVPEIVPLHAKLNIQTLALAGVEPAIGVDDELYNSLQGPRRQLWLDLLFAISTDESIIGASRHLLHIGQKGSA